MSYRSKEEMLENLKEAGCTNKQIQEVMKLYQEGKNLDVEKKLEHNRRKILEAVHKQEKQIECLDYFLYQLKKEEKSKTDFE